MNKNNDYLSTYSIIQDSCLEDLIVGVREYIELGWSLFGGVSVDPKSGKYLQTIAISGELARRNRNKELIYYFLANELDSMEKFGCSFWVHPNNPYHFNVELFRDSELFDGNKSHLCRENHLYKIDCEGDYFKMFALDDDHNYTRENPFDLFHPRVVGEEYAHPIHKEEK